MVAAHMAEASRDQAGRRGSAGPCSAPAVKTSISYAGLQQGCSLKSSQSLARDTAPVRQPGVANAQLW